MSCNFSLQKTQACSTFVSFGFNSTKMKKKEFLLKPDNSFFPNLKKSLKLSVKNVTRWLVFTSSHVTLSTIITVKSLERGFTTIWAWSRNHNSDNSSRGPCAASATRALAAKAICLWQTITIYNYCCTTVDEPLANQMPPIRSGQVVFQWMKPFCP